MTTVPPAVPPALDLSLREQHQLQFVPGTDALESAGGDGIFNADGTVNMVLIRPCNGRGAYNNIYEADVLQRDAGTFAGWTMFDGHDSPVARKARMGLPRSVSELAGTVRESWWDSAFTTTDDAKYGFGKGAVVGKCALTDPMEALVRKIPEAVKGSLNAQATNKRLGQRDGARGWIVEGFVNDPENSSFDLVTKAGAGGRVRSVLESLYDGSNATEGLTTALGSVSDEDLSAFLREHRPSVLESQGGAEPMNLQEALQSDEVKGYIKTMVQDGIKEGIQEAVADGGALDSTSIRQEIRDELAAASRLRGLAADARGIIEAAVLPQTAKDNLLADYGLTEDDDDTVVAGRSLRLIEAVVDGDGTVTKAAKAVLKDAVEEDVKRYRNVIREAAPTVPVAPHTSAGAGAGENDVQESAWEQKLRQRGLDPTQFGAPKREPAAAAK